MSVAKVHNVDKFEVFGLFGIPEILPRMDLSSALFKSLSNQGGVNENDIIVIASKVISKSEDMYLSTSEIVPSDSAFELEKKTGKPAKICQIVINESQSVWTNGAALLALHKQGFELSSAGVDRISDDLVILLPRDPDKSAREISQGLLQLSGKKVAVVISDSHGRGDRAGAGAVALGVYGIDPIRLSQTTMPNGKVKLADETICDMFAATAGIIMGQRGRGVPAVCIRGVSYDFTTDASVKRILHHASKV